MNEEFFRRAMMYWESYCRTGQMASLDNYIFWRMAYTDGKSEAIKNHLP